MTQRFQEPDGSVTEQVSPADLVWGGHGHQHWHARLGASYTLRRIGGSTAARRFRKAGFCFFDHEALAAAKAEPSPLRFGRETCAGQDALRISMGLSVGWSDPYLWTLPDQRIELAGLPSGRYRLTMTADPDGWFRETNERNNSSWVELRVNVAAAPPQIRIVRSSASVR